MYPTDDPTRFEVFTPVAPGSPIGIKTDVVLPQGTRTGTYQDTPLPADARVVRVKHSVYLAHDFKFHVKQWLKVGRLKEIFCEMYQLDPKKHSVRIGGSDANPIDEGTFMRAVWDQISDESPMEVVPKR